MTLLLLAGFFVFVFPARAGSITEEKIVGLVNESRRENKLTPLKESVFLSNAAADKIKDMVRRDYFAHTSPSGKTPWHWMEKAGYEYKYAGENLAINFSSAEKQHKAWMKSETHRRNILNSNFTEIGVAIAREKIEGKESVLVVQMFGTPMAVFLAKAGGSAPAVEKIITGKNNQENTALPDQEIQKREIFSVPINPPADLKIAGAEAGFAEINREAAAEIAYLSSIIAFQMTLVLAPFFIVVVAMESLWLEIRRRHKNPLPANLIHLS